MGNLLKDVNKTLRRLFDLHAYADFSGAESEKTQKQTIRLWMKAMGTLAQRITGAFTRDRLTSRVVELLRVATRENKRVIFGFDFQWSWPIALLKAAGIDHLPWRQALRSLATGEYGGPALSSPRTFCRDFNRWLVSRGEEPFFWSATKGYIYGIPNAESPAWKTSSRKFRLTERYKSDRGNGCAKPASRVGDNGSVGGQTILGLIQLYRLLEIVEAENLPVKFWPFDGVSIDDPAYDGCHVGVEVYPSALRPPSVKQTDDADAEHCCIYSEESDQQGQLAELLNLSELTPDEQLQVLKEGWILGHLSTR